MRHTRCDCGRVKSRGAGACPRCTRLDGRTKGEGTVIAALRSRGGMTSIAALARDLNQKPNAVNAVLLRLWRRARVARYLYEGEADHSTVFYALRMG